MTLRLTANCPTHGPFPSVMVMPGEGAVATLVNASQICPKCGASSPIQSGTFTVINNVIELVRKVSREDIQRLQRIALEAASGKISQEDAREKVNAVSQPFGSLLGSLTDAQLMLVVAVLTFLVTAYGALNPNSQLRSIHKEQLQQEIVAEQILATLEKQALTGDQILIEARRIADAAELTQAQPTLRGFQGPGRVTERLTKRQKRRLRGRRRS